MQIYGTAARMLPQSAYADSSLPEGAFECTFFPAPCLDIWQECDKMEQLKTMAEPKSHQRPKARGESESPRQVR